MAKQNKSTEAQPDQKRWNKIDLEAINQAVGGQANLAEMLGSMAAAGDGSIESQVSWLSNPRLSTVQRQGLATQIGQTQGNQHLQQVVSLVQRDDLPVEQNGPAGGASAGATGGGSISHATEQFYDVTGTTLDEVAPQLNHFGGHAAESNTPLGLSTSQVTPQRQEDGTYRVEVTWAINGATVGLPRWTNLGSACPAARTEWNRFMRQTRQHEQTAHINAARDFVANLEAADRVITGATIQEVQQNLQAKQQELAGRLQAIHDACDHGASIDAILHPDNGRCEESTGEAESGSFSEL